MLVTKTVLLSTIIVIGIQCLLTGGQFAYPADPNPPQVNSTFTCFVCDGPGCDVNRERGLHEEISCIGPRVACWIIKNTVTSLYTRTCERPPSIRQGVFCNRHMEGKEFCYASDTEQGRVRLCGKCCLNDRCNGGKVEGLPDETLQTCVACQGVSDEICNHELPLSVENSTFVEQCLLPNSDCWTERRRNRDNKIIFSRGCQLQTCDEINKRETCSTSNGDESCLTCCEGKLCNRFNGSPSSRSFDIKNILVPILIALQLLL